MSSGCQWTLCRAGDYWRYQAEFDENKEEPSEESLKAYEKAMELAAKSLKSTNPIRLGLSLNFSVFHYEIKNCPEDACKTAKEVSVMYNACIIDSLLVVW